MRRERQHKGRRENPERWLVSYADFITLLFAFFVVMYAVSEVDARKMKRLVGSVQFAFRFAGTGGLGELPIFEGPPRGEPPAHSLVKPVADLGKERAAARDRAELRALAHEVRRKLRNALPRIRRRASPNPRGMDDVVQVRLEERGLLIRLSLDYLFDTGGDKIVAAALPIIDRIAEAIRPSGREIRVEGHSDSRPIHTARFPSNWELSTARATNIVRYLIARHGFPPDRLSASGYAEYRPIADNRTPEGRARNRRVDIVVLSRTEARKEPATPEDVSGKAAGASPGAARAAK